MIFSARAQPTLATATPHQLLKPQSHLSDEHGQPILALQKTGDELITRLERIVRSLPESTPVASRQDQLAAFNIEPELLDNPNIEPNDLWELVINGFLKEHLGWGEEADMGKMVRRGEFGMAGVLQFCKYFIEKRGVSVGLFEGKLSRLLFAAETLCVDSVVINVAGELINR